MTILNSLATQNQTTPKSSLVLSGGGMRLSYQAGAMLALEEAGLTFHHFDATSGGSMNMSMLFSGLSPITMCERWASLKMQDSVSLLPLTDYLYANELEGVGDADGIRDKVFPHLGIDANKIQQIENVVGTYNVLDYGDKQVSVINHKDIDVDMMIAGISLPGVFPPVRKNGKTYLDTAFIQDANLMEAVRQGAEEIWLIWGLGNTGNYQGGALNIYIQMLETSANGALNNEINQIKALNKRIVAGDSVYGQTKPIELNIIQPARPLPLDPELYLGNITNETLIDMGYADAKAYLKSKQPNGLPIEDNMTKMIESEPGLRFCEAPSGSVAFENRNKETVELKLTIHIASLEKLLNEPTQTERITGRISINSIVENKIIDNGLFYVSTAKDNSEIKIFNYDIEFSANGESYKLIGKKKIFDDPGFDYIEDLSTVFVTLSKASNLNSPIAEGKLKLSITGLAKQAASIRTTHASSPIESAKMIAKFSQFYLRNEANQTQPA